jgi:hypothetical protein
MGALRRATLLTGVALLVSGVSAVARQVRESPKEAPPPSSTPTTAAPAPARDGFAGVWAYNADESLNSANGRKEDNAALRRAGNSGNNTSRGGGSNSGGGAGAGSAGGNTSAANPASAGGGGFGGGGGGYGNGPSSPFTSLIVNERRDLARDLLEIPVELKISLTDSAVTFVDHLRRELTYPTSGKKQKYQLSASVFEAKAYWDGAILKKEIEGSENFKMTETYMLSENGKRLFVMVRIYSPDKDTPPAGVNRVYDRVEK